jgi:conserved oligomeric Golgi complex subunit 1
MASNAIDPQTFKSWTDAFQHPIPNTRKFEQILRNRAEQNRQKLRTIVGASYRDLLGTADRIVAMDEQIHVVEDDLGFAGQKCNSKAIEGIFLNVAEFQRTTSSPSKCPVHLYKSHAKGRLR